MFTTGLIITTYNNPVRLNLCLQSIMQQSILPDELLIADDGSTIATREVISQFSRKFKIKVKHVYQEDDGFQLARIRNKAFAQSTCDYLIQTDGDLIFHKHFVRDHIAFAKPGCFVSGARTNIIQNHTELLLKNNTVPGLKYYSKGLTKRYNALRNGFLRELNALLQTSPHNMHYVLGCNMAFWKKDLQQVNGYNEIFKGWGKEDNDIAARLINAGKNLRFLKFGGIVFHLWHKGYSAVMLSENEKIFNRSVQNKLTVAEKGMNQYEIAGNESRLASPHTGEPLPMHIGK